MPGLELSTAFSLLPWVGNGINYAESTGRDVLSGPFTGGIMAVYMRSGVRRVCHVATPECNGAWAKLKRETPVVKEFFCDRDKVGTSMKVLKTVPV